MEIWGQTYLVKARREAVIRSEQHYQIVLLIQKILAKEKSTYSPLI